MKSKKTFILGNLIITVLLAISIIVWYRVYEVYTLPEEKGLTVTFLNVGQGDSILITTPEKKHILIDGGTMPKEWSTFDAGKKVVVPYLNKKGIKKLDLVIATHPDLDHIGGLRAVLEQIEVETFIDSGTISTTQTYEDLLKLIENKKIKYKIAEQGILFSEPSLTLKIFSPISSTFSNDSNNNSIVARLEYNKAKDPRSTVSFLFTADIGEAAEKLYIQKYGNELSSTVLKVAHHGGKNASSDKFLQAVKPDVIIISCGKNNPFGHPAEETLERLKKTGAIIYRTDESGTITILTDGEKYYVSTIKKQETNKFQQPKNQIPN